MEHPADSHAWEWYGLNKPSRDGGWIKADDIGYTCCVSQGHYGHFAGKRTWLYVVRTKRPELAWGACEQRLHPVALERYGYETARRIGMMAMIGGKDKQKIREATPEPFRDLLLWLAASVE